jgi:AcrR family transcriptional regulator
MVRIVKKPAERKQDIIAAARLLFEQNGYDQVSMQAVMDHLGIAKGTIYHYFQSKEELFEAVTQAIVSEEVEQLEQFLQTLTGSALEKIQALVSAGNARTRTQGALLHQLHQPANQGIHTRIAAISLVQQARLFETLIRQGCEEGVFNTPHPRECAEFILAATQFLTDPGFYPWSPAELARRRQALPALIEKQLNAPSGSFQFLAGTPT